MTDFSPFFEQYGQQFNLDPALLQSIASNESSMQPDAVGPATRTGAHAHGVMQIMPENFESLGITDPNDPDQNIRGGSNLLRQYMDKAGGNIDLALRYYNAGPNAGEKTLHSAGVNAYVNKVLGKYSQLTGQNRVQLTGNQGGAVSDDDWNSLMQGGAGTDSVSTPAIVREQPGFMVGVGRGLTDVYNTGLDLRDWVADHMGLDGQANRAHEKLARDAETEYYNGMPGTDLLSAGGIGRLVGQALPTIAGGEAIGLGRALPAAGNALFKGAPAVVQAVGRNALTGAGFGALGGAETEAASPNTPVGSQVGAGAAAGAGLGLFAPAVAPLLRRVGEALGEGFGALRPGAAAAAAKAAAAQNQLAPAAAGAAGGLSAGPITPEIAAALRDVGLDVNNMPPEKQAAVAQSVAQHLQAYGKVDPEAVARQANQNDLGFMPTNGSVTRNPLHWTNEVELSKDLNNPDPRVAASARQMMAIRQHNTDTGGTLLDDMADRTGPAGPDGEHPYAPANALMTAVKQKYADMRAGVSDLYDKARAAYGDSFAGSPLRVAEVMKSLDTEAAADPAVERYLNAVKTEFKKAGVMDSAGNPVSLEPESKLVDANGNPISSGEPPSYAAVTGDRAEAIYQRIGSQLYDTLAGSRLGRRVQRQVLQAWDDDVFSSLPQGNPFAAGRAAHKAMAQEMESSPIIEKILDGDMPPEDLMKRIMHTGNDSDVQALRHALFSGTQDQVQRGAAAWQKVGRRAAELVSDSARANDGSVNFRNLNKALNAVGPVRGPLLWGDTGWNRYGRIASGIHDTSVGPAFRFDNTSNTSVHMHDRLLRMMEAYSRAGHIPLVGGILLGHPGVGIAAEMIGSMTKKMAERRAANEAQAVVRGATALHNPLTQQPAPP